MRIFVVIAFLVASLPVWANETEAVRAYIEHDKRKLRPSKIASAVELVDPIVTISKEEGIDPMLTAVMIRFESSFRPGVVGKLGERGLMQVHGIALNGRKLATVRDEVRRGVVYLAACVRRCGSILGGINRYMSGRCDPIYNRPRARWRHYQWATQKFKGGKDEI